MLVFRIALFCMENRRARERLAQVRGVIGSRKEKVVPIKLTGTHTVDIFATVLVWAGSMEVPLHLVDVEALDLGEIGRVTSRIDGSKVRWSRRRSRKRGR